MTAILLLLPRSGSAASSRPTAATPSSVNLEELGPVPTRGDGVTFSPDGRRVAYVAVQGGRYVVMLDGTAGSRYDDVLEVSAALAVGESSATAGTVALRDVINPASASARAHPRTLLFSPDGAGFAYVARRGREHFVVLDGQESAGYARIVACGFSPGGTRFAYVAESAEGQSHVVIDGMESPAFTAVDLFVFSANGERHAYVARLQEGNAESRFTLVVDGATQQRAMADTITDLTFSPDGRSFAYMRIPPRGNSHVVLDGRSGPAHASIVPGSLRFSADGAHLAYFARTIAQKFQLVLDGRSGDLFDEVFLDDPDTLRFEADGSLRFLAVKGRTYVRATTAPLANASLANITATGAQPSSSGSASGNPRPDANVPPVDGPLGEIQRTADEVGQALDALGGLFGGRPKEKK